MHDKIQIAVHGAAGRMGQRVVALTVQDAAQAQAESSDTPRPSFELVGAIDHADHPLIGQDAAMVAGESHQGIPISSGWPETADVVIDFSLPEAIDICVSRCVENKFPLVIATTGLSDEQRQRIREASAAIPIVWAPSMSLAVNLSMRLTQQITAALKDVTGGLDIEILERHHRFKADAPSGTALKFGELIANEMDGEINHVHGREGHTGQRPRSEIGYHAIRVGDNPGEHTIVFGMLGERIELNVAASNRDCYAAGSLAAARWLMTGGPGNSVKPPGLYDMFDVLSLNDHD